MAATCDCSCHCGQAYDCSIPGGCGSIGCGRTKPGGCVTCPTIRPDADPRLPHNPPVCDGDRNLLDRWLLEVANLHAVLVNGEQPEPDRRRYERFGLKYNKDGTRETVSLGETWADPLAAFGGVAPVPSKSKQPAVNGSREAPVPIRVDLVDVTATARHPEPTEQGRQHPEDQIGHLAAATVLDQWARDWRDTLFPDQHLPPATVDELVAWLRNRLWDACDRHPAIEEFADEVRALRGVLRRIAGEGEPQPERIEGVRCATCRMANVLLTVPDGAYRAECGYCGALYSEAEHTEHVGTQAKAERDSRTAADVAALLRSAVPST